MIESVPACRVAAAVFREEAEPIAQALEEKGIISRYMAPGRFIILEDRKGFFGIGARSVVTQEPVECISFLVSPEYEAAVLDLIVQSGKLNIPGRGFVFSEEILIHMAHDLCRVNSVDSEHALSSTSALSELTGICCIVQRGQGDAVARLALDTGTCVPVITFGTGTGFRDKLGLLRVTIPAEKEIIVLAAGVDDAGPVMDLMIEAGGLDQPGKGFVYLFPLRRGILNTGIWRGGRKHAASMEQIIATIDELKGGTSWRSSSGMSAAKNKAGHKYLLDKVDLTLVCDEGPTGDFVRAAMAAGAAGATTSKLRHVCPHDSIYARVSPSRECSNMIVSRNLIPAVTEALERAGAFRDSAHGLLFSRAVPRACTYLGGQDNRVGSHLT